MATKPKPNPHEECRRAFDALMVINKDLAARIKLLETRLTEVMDGKAGPEEDDETVDAGAPEAGDPEAEEAPVRPDAEDDPRPVDEEDRW